MSTPKWVSIKSKWNWGSPRSNHSDSSTVELCPFVTGLGHRPCGPLVPSVIYWQLLPNDFIIHFIPEVPGGSQTCFGLYWGGWGGCFVWSTCWAQSGLEAMTLLSQPCKYWNYRNVPSHLAYKNVFAKLFWACSHFWHLFRKICWHQLHIHRRQCW